MKRILFFSLLLLFLCNHLHAQEVCSSPKYEVRAVWLTTIGGLDWPRRYAQNATAIAQQQDELRRMLDQLQQAGINMILLQTRIRATTIYPSKYEIWDGCLSGQPGKGPGYDALRFAIEECHARGMECHAWIVSLPVGKWNSAGCKDIRNRMPGNIIKVGADGYMNPETTQTADYLARLCREIVEQYDVDGIHLDYIRYPEDWRTKTSPSHARGYITRIVERISKNVKEVKPWVKMSCSPIGKYSDLDRYSSRGWNAYSRVHQDAQLWLREGYMDMLLPMMYFKDNNFYPFLLDWKEQSSNKAIAAGLGIYMMSPKERNWSLSDITREMNVSRIHGVGQAYFRARFFTDNEKGIYTYTRDHFYRYPALLPPILNPKSATAKAPTMLRVSKTGQGGTRISWQGDATYYNIYFSKTFPVDTSKGENLLAVRYRDKEFVFSSHTAQPYYYAVTSMDRYGNESMPIQQNGSPGTQKNDNMLACDGQHVVVPEEYLVSNAYYCIETLQGNIIATAKENHGSIEVGSIADGMYTLRSVNPKGKSHRVGFFCIRRKRS